MYAISKKRSIHNFTAKINDKPLEQCESYKYLGVYIDKNLSWKPHVNYVSTKISKACGAFSKTRHCVDIATLKCMYYALVHSYLRYGLIAWGNAASQILQPLQSLNNRVLRIMTFAPLGRLDTSIIYNHLKILNVEKTFVLETCKFIYKSKNGLLPLHLQSIASHFNRSTPRHSHGTRTRNRNIFSTIPHEYLSEHAQKSIQCKAVSMWENTSNCIRDSESLGIFKNSLKSHLLEN